MSSGVIISVAMATLISAAALATPAQQAFENNVIRYLAAAIDRPEEARRTIRKVSKMDFESGRTAPDDVATYSGQLPKFRAETIQFQGDQVLVDMVGTRLGNVKCVDRLTTWFRPAGAKLDVVYAIRPNGRCSQPIAILPAAPKD